MERRAYVKLGHRDERTSLPAAGQRRAGRPLANAADFDMLSVRSLEGFSWLCGQDSQL